MKHIKWLHVVVSYQIVERTLQKLKCYIRERKQHESGVWEIWIRVKEKSQKHREWGPKQGLRGHHKDMDIVTSINFERKLNMQLHRLGVSMVKRLAVWTERRSDYYLKQWWCQSQQEKDLQYYKSLGGRTWAHFWKMRESPNIAISYS